MRFIRFLIMVALLVAPSLASAQRAYWTQQLDQNGNCIGDGALELLCFTETPSAVNEITFTNGAAGNPAIVQIDATGDDTNIHLNLDSKGTGLVRANGIEVVDLSKVQTLQNKTLGGTNTIEAGAYDAASIDGDDINANLGGDGIVLNTATSPDSLDIDLNATLDGVGLSTSLSGMEFTATNELALLQDCANNDVLKWVDAGATWETNWIMDFERLSGDIHPGESGLTRA